MNETPETPLRQSARLLAACFHERVEPDEDGIAAIEAALRPLLLAARPGYVAPTLPLATAGMGEVVAEMEQREAYLRETLPVLESEHARLTRELDAARTESEAVAVKLAPLRELLRPGMQQRLLDVGTPGPAKRTATVRKMDAAWVPDTIDTLAAELLRPREDILEAARQFRDVMIREKAEYARWGTVFRAALARGEFLPPAQANEVRIPDFTAAAQSIARGDDPS